MEPSVIPGFRNVPRTGVIYVMHEAAQNGFTYEDEGWANLGQGSPETGSLPGAPPRIEAITIPAANQQYAPIPGNRDLRQAVADFYNATYRKGKKSQYTVENVSIASGGRLALTRLATALSNINMGHFIPDYTAYEELLSVFKAFIPIPILLDADSGYKITPAALKKAILGRGLSALLVSNPCNPTGQLIENGELAAWCDLARDCRCSLIVDEFYSHFIYNNGYSQIGKTISAAEYVEDVESDPIIVVDGLTKNWRYPGWRISWTLAPQAVIETIASAGSWSSGASRCSECPLPLLTGPGLQETVAIRTSAGATTLARLRRLRRGGREPDGGFYVR
jgi:aspartate/methionine/tyrosine aminotransferase